AGEVAGLGPDDIDWRRGEVTVRGKGGRRDRLPLPADVGAAIVAYLRSGRPAGALNRTVFIAAQAPREAVSYLGITTIVAEAARRGPRVRLLPARHRPVSGGPPGWADPPRERPRTPLPLLRCPGRITRTVSGLASAARGSRRARPVTAGSRG